MKRDQRETVTLEIACASHALSAAHWRSKVWVWLKGARWILHLGFEVEHSGLGHLVKI